MKLFLHELLKSIDNPVIYVPIRHYICRESSTNQLFFMQNKPNFQKAQMNVNTVLTMDYDKKDTWWSGKNKPNSKPIQSQTNPIYEKQKMNVSYIITKGYENKSHFWVKAKQTQYKPNQTQFRRQMLLIYAPLEVLEKSIMTGYYLEPIRHIKS